MRIISCAVSLLLSVCMLLSGCAGGTAAPAGQSVPAQSQSSQASQTASQPSSAQQSSAAESAIPDYAGTPYVSVNGGSPKFSDSDLTAEPFERYSALDSIGRCGTAFANVCRETMPTEKRGDIGSVKPTGWHLVKYDFVDGKYLFNRCHLIGFQLTGENANEKNLITGTRYLNVDGMLPFENMVADYVKETGNHVLYRVTPVFAGKNLVASGVLMEAESVEDKGAGVMFCVYCYNCQPGVTIDYATGESALADGQSASSSRESQEQTEQTYVLNTNTKKFHYPTCPSVSEIKDGYKETYTGSRDELTAQGYSPCGRCKP